VHASTSAYTVSPVGNADWMPSESSESFLVRGATGRGRVPQGAKAARGARVRSDRSADAFLKLLAIAAAERQSRAVLQEHDVLSVEPRLQLADALDVDDV
jgi:hypothetical protein